jgi:hypothetical protein
MSDPRHQIALVDFLQPESLSRPEKINECDPVARIDTRAVLLLKCLMSRLQGQTLVFQQLLTVVQK